MGGDRAPVEVLHGAVAAVQRGADIVLVGDETLVRPFLSEAGVDIPVVHSDEVITMSDDPVASLRTKRGASISVAARLVASGDADGLVSAGSTGAAMAAATLLIGRLPEVARPAIGTFLPTNKLILDTGANLAARAEHLVQFAIMGSALAASRFHLDRPRVGLLNIGEEATKGREVEREAYLLLSELADINFVGNVEGRDLGTDVTDVFVTDGFTGNVLLKTAEGTSQLVQGVLRQTLARPELAEALGVVGPALAEARTRLDPETEGGAHLLGIAGVVVIAHGSSSRTAIANAIMMAAEGAADRLPAQIEKGLAAVAAGA